MSDPLFDGGPHGDPELARLEGLLSAYRYRPWSRRVAPRAALALAAAVLLAVGFWSLRRGPAPWTVDTASCRGCAWEAGVWLDTEEVARARIADRGELRAQPGARVRLDERGDSARLTLEEGVVEVRLAAPARWLVIRVPGVDVVDLGCAYRLQVAPEGTGGVLVLTGEVALEGSGPPTFVPAGAAAATWPDGRTGLPLFLDGATPELVAAVDRFDVAGELGPLLGAATRDVDAWTLWHALRRVAPAERPALLDAIDASLRGPLPADRGRLEALDEEALTRLLATIRGQVVE